MPTHFTIRSPIMTDVVWCIPTRGITYSVSHHDECCLVHPDTWYQLFGSISHHDGCRLLHPDTWYHLFGSISHHDGCRLVHPDTWYHLFGSISHHDGCRLVHTDTCITYSVQSPIMTDFVWYIPTRGIT